MAEGQGPIRITKKGRPPAVHPRRPLFYIDDKEYTVIDPVPAVFMVRFMRDQRYMPYEAALVRMVDTIMGQEAVDALAECDDLTEGEFAEIMTAVRKKAAGSVADALGE